MRQNEISIWRHIFTHAMAILVTFLLCTLVYQKRLDVVQTKNPTTKTLQNTSTATSGWIKSNGTIYSVTPIVADPNCACHIVDRADIVVSNKKLLCPTWGVLGNELPSKKNGK